VRLTLRVERLVVDGLPLSHRDRRALAAAIESELVARLSGNVGSWPSHGAALRVVRGTPVGVGPDRPVAALGTEVAGSIHAAIGRAVGT
jgi:hypothetical protein